MSDHATRAVHVEPPPTTQQDGAAEDYYIASQWRLMWWKFRKHKLAVVSTGVILFFYLLAAFCEFFAPYGLQTRQIDYVFAGPSRIHFIDQGRLHLRPFVYGLDTARDPVTLRRSYTEDPSRKFFLKFFVRGVPYEMWGVFDSNLHFVGVEEGGTLFLFGTDRLGRDVFSRVVYGARISLSIGLVGVVLSLVMGLTLGGVSGYYGGVTDTVVQRIIELLRSFPTIPLWMALSAALPAQWSPLRVYFGITVILSLVSWTGLARVVRGKLLSIRNEDFATAALVSGATEFTTIVRHLLPSFMSHIIVTVTLAIPSMVLAETALSFLDLGLRPPVTSWGVLLREAQNIRTVSLQPWLLLPAVFVIVTVLAFNFAGDGLRDAADPYAP